jgi:hypothetical protein
MQKKLHYRYLCKTLNHQITCAFLSMTVDLIKSQIAIRKGFSAYTPVIK